MLEIKSPEIREVNIIRYVQPFREGGSLPGLVDADDGFSYVIKFRGAGQGKKALVAEFIGGELARFLGLRVPEMVYADLDVGFGRTEPDEEIQDLLKFSVGKNLGVSYLNGAITFDANVDEISSEEASKIVWLDALLMNVDRTVKNWKRYHDSYDAVRDDIEQCIPGFDNYNVRVREKGGFYLPNEARDKQYFSKKLEGKAPFTLTEVPDNTLADDEYMMATTRTHDQFNTTIYGLDDRYRGIKNERRVIFMNQKDIDKAGFKAGDKVDLYNFDDGIERVAPLFIIVSYQIPEKNTVTYFPETNVLVSVNNVVKESNMPASKYVKIKIKPHDPAVYKKVDQMLYQGAIQRP